MIDNPIALILSLHIVCICQNITCIPKICITCIYQTKMRLHSSVFVIIIKFLGVGGLECNHITFGKKLYWSDKEIPETIFQHLVGRNKTELERLDSKVYFWSFLIFKSTQHTQEPYFGESFYAPQQCQERQLENRRGNHSYSTLYLKHSGHSNRNNSPLSPFSAPEKNSEVFAQGERLTIRSENTKTLLKETVFIWNIMWESSSLRVLLKQLEILMVNH